ncbi:hypothetical protein MHBO_004663 [Bonamia ostreae]|uniref:LAGLIDADG homing endonuclease n=1 Tax=Bonamia ostreae TaxID=126728 RepID=A0ABV2ATX9_9EUKA
MINNENFNDRAQNGFSNRKSFAGDSKLQMNGKTENDNFGPSQNGEKIEAILLMRNNANFRQYGQYASLASKNDWIVHIVPPFEFRKDILRYFAVCLYSVYRRGENHPTFRKMTNAKRFAITSSFLSSFEAGMVKNDVGYLTEAKWLVSDKVKTSLNFFNFCDLIKSIFL